MARSSAGTSIITTFGALKQNAVSLAGILIITILLAADCFIIAWHSGAIHQKLGENLTNSLPVFFSAGRATAMLTGIYTGIFLAPFVPDFNYFFGISLIAVIGLKLAIESIRFIPEEKVIFIDNNKTLALLTLAGSMNTFFAGFGLGLTGTDIPVPVLVTAFAVLILAFAGKILGKRKSLKPEIRIIGLFSGIIILALASRLLILYFI